MEVIPKIFISTSSKNLSRYLFYRLKIRALDDIPNFDFGLTFLNKTVEHCLLIERGT